MRTCWGVHKADGLHAWWFIDAHVAAPICRLQLLLYGCAMHVGAGVAMLSMVILFYLWKVTTASCCG